MTSMSPRWTQPPSDPTFANVYDVNRSGTWLRTAPFRRMVRWRRYHERIKRLKEVNNQRHAGRIRPEQRIQHKSASIIMPAGATTLDASDYTYVKGAEAQILSSTASGVTRPSKYPHDHESNSSQQCNKTLASLPRVVTRLRRVAWVNGLQDHPDQTFAGKLIEYIDHGVPLLYQGPELNQVFPNWKSCDKLKTEVESSMLYDIEKQWKVGPFATQPFKHFVGSPMGAFTKPSPTGPPKFRVIHDLSWPPYRSVNFFIPESLCSVKYVTIDSAVSIVKLLGASCLMAKIDLEHAYKQIGVRQQDWCLLGSTWPNDRGETQYFFDTVLPFGGRSSAALFNAFADGLEHIMYKNGVSHLIHYLDDMFTAGLANTDECFNNMTTMLDTCTDCGVAVNPKKIIPPTTEIEFLGVIIDSVRMELRMSETRLDSIKNELQWWLGRKVGSKRALLSLIGKLVFLCRVIQPGRTFLRRLISLSTRATQLYHKLKLNSMAREDILWWIRCVDQWNRKSVFLDDLWSTSAELNFYTDASGYGIGGVYRDLWFAQEFTTEHSRRSIAWRELYAVVVACRLWGPLLTGRRMLLQCDNESVVSIVNTGTSKCDLVMELVRSLFDTVVQHNFDLKLVHIPGVDNIAADMLSRGHIDLYKSTFVNCA
jgi:hypothetical protein